MLPIVPIVYLSSWPNGRYFCDDFSKMNQSRLSHWQKIWPGGWLPGDYSSRRQSLKCPSPKAKELRKEAKKKRKKNLEKETHFPINPCVLAICLRSVVKKGSTATGRWSYLCVFSIKLFKLRNSFQFPSFKVYLSNHMVNLWEEIICRYILLWVLHRLRRRLLYVRTYDLQWAHNLYIYLKIINVFFYFTSSRLISCLS